ncbi:MAG TPA: hypothetical protein VJS68_00935, partial [Thermoplasmata archaeon]|nr:hypothetical protein [Thermoplasmata archaeon]
MPRRSPVDPALRAADRLFRTLEAALTDPATQSASLRVAEAFARLIHDARRAPPPHRPPREDLALLA